MVAPSGLLGMLFVSGMTLGPAWPVLVPVTAMYAWRTERDPAVADQRGAG